MSTAEKSVEAGATPAIEESNTLAEAETSLPAPTDAPGKAPVGLKWRCSPGFITLVVGFGVATDLFVYSSIIPVIPFQLERLGYSTGVASELTGWLLFVFSGGLAAFTIPIAWVSERYGLRKSPLIVAMLVLIGSQIMFMEAPIYAVMCIARVLQGFASTMVWVVGMALLCDNVPPDSMGKYIGMAMSGMSAGTLAGPPIGGAIYTRFGFRGPFIFGMGVAVLDLIGRILVIERKEALRWGYDPLAVQETADEEKQGEPTATPDSGPVTAPSLLQVITRLFKSSRAAVIMVICVLYGIIYAAMEPTLPLHLQDIWGLNSSKVGLIYLGSAVPSLLSSPLAGWLSDRQGVEWICALCLSLGFVWYLVLIVQKSLALFIVAYVLESFFVGGTLSPVMTDLANISRSIEGVGFAHVYGAFNIMFSAGSTVGPVLGGQVSGSDVDGSDTDGCCLDLRSFPAWLDDHNSGWRWDFPCLHFTLGDVHGRRSSLPTAET
ncbi:unnamed protein product [Mycena citricolor]|uniref:Major facilitator superfamily (MFS) profile domain-containing protein n=1 Tax=Mycena citricolor TaxID=2018698 RepID=A0AAD2HQ34_9AGAR|nr:unnamed protein product [Mycena citricolor]